MITVNGNHKKERQRFTVLHEIAHIVLELPSEHHGTTITTQELISYRARPKEGGAVMAEAELVLP